MEKNNFIVDLIASLKKGQSKKQINSDIKNLGEIKIPFVGKLDKPKTRKQIKNDIKSLGDIYVPLIGKLSSKSKTVSQIKKDLAGVEIPVDLTGKVNKKGIVTSVQQATQQAQAVANKNKIKYDASFNIKKTKLLADIQYFAQQNSKMMKDANMASKYNTLLDNAKLATSNKEIRNLRMQLSAMRSELRANNLAGLTLGDTLKKTFKRAMELFSGTGFVMLLSQQLRQAWQESLNLDKAFTDLVKVQSNLTRGDYPQYLEQCTRKAKELATTQQALIEGATEFSKSGYDLTTSNKLTEQSTILSNVGDMSASDSAKAIISGVQAYDVVDGYDDVIDKAGALIDKYNEIGNTASITTAEIAQGVQSVGSVFADANTSVDEFIALLAAGNRQYQDADALALGLRTAALRIRGCKVELEQMGEETDGVYTSASKLAEKIEGLTNINGNGGVKILEADGENFRSIYDIFLDISKVYKDMSDTDASALLELISGKHRASAISATLNNMTEAQEIYKRSLESAGSAQREYDKYLESSLASLNTFKANMIDTYQDVFNGGTTKAILDAGSSVLEFANSLGLVESTLKSFIAIGAVKGITSLSTAFKASTLQASNFGKALQFSNSIPNGNLSQRFTMLKNIAIASKSLNDAQLKLVLSNKALSNEDRIRVMRLMGMEKSLAQAKLAEYGLTQATKAQSTAQKAATINTFSFSAAVKGLGMNLRLAFMSNPVGISIMALSTIIGAVSSKVSEYNEKLRETRQANMDAATSAKEKADSLRDLYVQYENLSGITNRTSSQEEQFKQVVIDITKALGDKASALEGLTAGQNDYTEALKEATKAELESQYATAKIGAKAAEEELKDKTYDFWTGSQITILQNEQMAGVKEHMAALEAVKDILAEYEDIGMQGDMVVTQWEPVNWDENRNDMMAVVEYYNALVEARNRLATADNADFLMSSDIYEDINTTINDLTESVEKYTEQQYNALKLNYEWQNGVPSTEEEFRKMEESILNASGAGKEFQEILKGYLAEDFSTFSEAATKNIGDLSGAVENATQLSSDILSFSEVWNDEDFSKAKDELLALAEAGRLTPETLQSTEEYKKLLEQTGMSAEEAAKKINSMTDASTQLQSMSAQISKMSDMLADKKNGTTASADDLASFDVEVRGLESWKEFENVMMSSNSTMEQCQQAANDLATEWVNNSNFLANLTEETKQSYITQLEKMGVENAEQVVLTALGASTEYATLAIAHNSDEKNRNIQVSTDLSNATADEIIQLINEGNASDETANSLYHYALEKSNASNLTLATAADCSNLYNLVSALGVASSALKNYAYAKRVLESAQKWDDSPLKDAAIANAENTLKSLEASATKDIKTVFDKTNNVKISPKGSSGYKAPSTGKSKSGSGSSKSDTKQTVDWISRLLDVLQKKIDATKAKFDNLFTLKSKNNNLNTQINQTKALLTATNKAADKYKKQADKVGLSKSLKKKVQSGDYNISNYSSETADKIQKYQDYYDKYKELKQQADELTTDIRNLRTERYQLYVDDAEAKISKSQVYAELDAGNYKEQNKHLEYQKKQLKTQYDYLIKIAELNKDSVEVAKLKAEYQKELNDLTMQEFDNIANTYDNKVGLNNNKIKAFQDQISLLEAKGQKIGSALYTKQMSLNNINEKKLVAEREKLIEKLNEIPKGTDDWYKAQDTLFSVESELVNVQIENANLQKSINQLKFDRFDDLLNKLNDIVNETDFLIDMLDSENFFDDNGKITDDGITAMGMYAQNYDTYLAEAEQYKQMLSDVKDMYDAGKISLEDYEEYQRTYAQGQRDAIKNANDCKKAVIDYVKQGLDAQNQALEREIENRKKLLAEQKESRDFNKKILDLNKEIARTERQLEVLNSGADNSEENRKKVRELKSKLEDLKSDRDDTLYDKSIEDQQNALDKMLTDAQDASSQYLKNSEVVFVDALNKVNANTEIVSKNLEKISSDLGYDISSNITDAWKDGGKAVDTYESILQGNIPKITTQIGLITSAWNEACEAAEKAAQAIVDATTDDYLEHTTIGANGNNNGNGSSSETKKDNITTILENGSNKNPTSELAKAVRSAYGEGLTKGEMYQISSILKLGYKKEDFYDDSAIRNKAKNDVLQALIKKGYLKKSGNSYLRGFAKGGVISELSDAIRLNGDTVLVSAKPGERMLTEQQNGYWEKWTQSLPNLMNLTDIIKPNVNIPTAIPTINREQSPVYNIDSSITVDGVATNEIVKDMANVAKKQAENVISEINRRTYAKGVRWK